MLDLKGGRAVHAVAGRRAHYQPVESILHPGSDPLALAVALHDELGMRSLYLADLDAIAGHAPQVRLYQNMIALGFHLIVDAGVRDLQHSQRLLASITPRARLSRGSRHWQAPRPYARFSTPSAPGGSSSVSISIEAPRGRPRGPHGRAENPLELAREAIEQGVRQVLLLDLARVGTGRGSGTNGLLPQILARHPEVQVSVGGGISGASEILALKAAGAHAVLVASAIHDGRIGRRELVSLDAAL